MASAVDDPAQAIVEGAVRRASFPISHPARRRDRTWMSLTRRSLYPFVLSWFGEIDRAARADLRVVDLPAGDGLQTMMLGAAGFNATPMDLFPEAFGRGMENAAEQGLVEMFESRTGAALPAWLRRSLFGEAPAEAISAPAMTSVRADMEARLPLDDASVDVLLCVEGIEHVRDRHAVLEEFRRVLRPGGRLLLTTPNMLSLRARLAYAVAGQRAFKSYVDEYTSVWGRSDDGARVYHGHAFLVNYFQVRYSLHHCGFRLRRLLNSNWSPSSVALLPAAALVAAGTWTSQRRAKKKFAKMQADGRVPKGVEPPYGEMFQHLLSPQLLLNSTLIVEADAVATS